MNGPQKSGWDTYRWWRKAMWISIPGFLLLYFTLSYLPLPEWLRAFLAFLPPFVSLTRLQHYKCPRCGNQFFYDGSWNPWTKNCRHCGLPKWEEATFVEPEAFADLPHNPKPDPAVAERLRVKNFLTLVLRDDPGAIHLTLDSEGWADVNNLLTRANRYGFKLIRENLTNVTASTEESLLEWDQSGDRIRARR